MRMKDSLIQSRTNLINALFISAESSMFMGNSNIYLVYFLLHTSFNILCRNINE